MSIQDVGGIYKYPLRKQDLDDLRKERAHIISTNQLRKKLTDSETTIADLTKRIEQLENP